MNNQKLALEIAQALTERGLREFCVCPGARNSPLVALLLRLPGIRLFHHFEERAAAFFALGRIKATHQPVAVVTTSGTAVGELLPATMEAYYAGLPLVLLTADRPRRFRGSGAPQTAEQPGIFGIYAERCFDLAADEGHGRGMALSEWSGKAPLHINACFDEPLLDRSAEAEIPNFRVLPQNEDRSPKPHESNFDKIREDLKEFLNRSKNPIAVVSALPVIDRKAVRSFLLATGLPAYFEAPSGLREDTELAAQRIHVSDGLGERARGQNYPIDGVVRIGGVPTFRYWRDLEASELPVFSLSREPFSGLSGRKIQAVPIGDVLKGFQATKKGLNPGAFLNRDRDIFTALESALQKYPRSEPALFRALSEIMQSSARLFLGNSLPIREWDLAATFERGVSSVGASRGLNGIDGQISTFLGFCDPLRENWAVIGDLTTLYDLSAPWIVSQLAPETRATLVVVNNRGGKIFSRMFPQQPEFQNPHALEFSKWAALWNLPYERWEAIQPSVSPSSSPLRVVELTPDAEQTDRFWQEMQPLWKN